MSAPPKALQILEAVLFASGKPLSARELAAYVPRGTKISALLQELEAHYAARGIRLVRRGDKYALRTAAELAPHLQKHVVRQQRLSRAALEVLAIIAWHQPATKAEIEAIRGVMLGHGTLDKLLETQWIRILGRRALPGRPLEYGTSPAFLDHFNLPDLASLPGPEELRNLTALERRLGAPPSEESLYQAEDDAAAEEERKAEQAQNPQDARESDASFLPHSSARS